MTQGYKVKEFGQPVKRYVQLLRLRNDEELIRAYRIAHDRQHFSPEILHGIQEVGILEMELYIVGNTEVMIVEAPLDFNWDEAMDRLAKLPGQQEWEDFVSQFQQASPGETSNEKWKMSERFFHLYEDLK